MPLVPTQPIDLGTGVRWPPAGGSSRRAAVFVHGWNGDPIETWRRKASTSLIDYLAGDPEIKWEFFSVKHTGGAFNEASIDAIAETIGTFIANYVQNHDLVALIAHSLGGLGCRQFIVNEIAAKSRRDLTVGGLLMFGTPNDGTSMAKAAGKMLWSFAGDEMQPYSEKLLQLNRAWLTHVSNGGDPTLSIDQRAPVVCWNVVGTSDAIVKRSSAQHLSLLGDVQTLPYDHLGLVKPSHAHDAPVVRVRQFLDIVEQRYRERQHEIACDVLAAEVRRRAAKEEWISAEEQTIDIETLADDEKARFPADAHIFRLTVTTKMNNVSCSDVIRIGLRLDSVNYAPDTTVKFDLQVGKGVIGNAVDDEIRRGVRAERLRDFVSVKYIRAQHTGTAFVYEPENPVAGEGSFLLPFRCAKFPRGVSRIDQLEVQVTSYVDLAMGWYTYICESTITRRLTVRLHVPFTTTCLMQSPIREAAAPPRENELIGGRYSNEVTVEQPVAPGTRIIWVWR